MDFEDELAKIVSEQVNAKSLNEVTDMLRDRDTFGYVVFIAPSGANGIIMLGEQGRKPEKLAYAHRIADRLIDDVVYADEDSSEGD